MFFHKTIVQVADNSGVKYAKCIRVLKTSLSASNKQQIAFAGNLILVSSRILKSNIKIKKGQLFKALIVRTKRPVLRLYGTLSFAKNWVILLNKRQEPQGNRIFGVILKEALDSNFVKFEAVRIYDI